MGTRQPITKKKQKPDRQELLQWASFFYDLYEKEKQKKQPNCTEKRNWDN